MPAHSVLDLKGKEQPCLFALYFFRVVLFAEGNISKVTAGSCSVPLYKQTFPQQAENEPFLR